MTIPKRYEETAKRIVGVVLYNEDRVEQVSALVATAAREAQVRVLAEVLDVYCLFPNTTLYTALTELRARIENGEDI